MKGDLQGDNASAYGEFNEISFVVDIKLLHHACLVRFRCSNADNQHLGDLFCGVTFRYQLQYFPLPIGKLMVRIFFIIRGDVLLAFVD